MKTSGFRCETKFGLLVFLGHPTGHIGAVQQLFWRAAPYEGGRQGSLGDQWKDLGRWQEGWQWGLKCHLGGSLWVIEYGPLILFCAINNGQLCICFCLSISGLIQCFALFDDDAGSVNLRVLYFTIKTTKPGSQLSSECHWRALGFLSRMFSKTSRSSRLSFSIFSTDAPTRLCFKTCKSKRRARLT